MEGPPSGVRSVSITVTCTFSKGRPNSCAVQAASTPTRFCPISALLVRIAAVPSVKTSTSASDLSGAPPPRPVFL